MMKIKLETRDANSYILGMQTQSNLHLAQVRNFAKQANDFNRNPKITHQETDENRLGFDLLPDNIKSLWAIFKKAHGGTEFAKQRSFEDEFYGDPEYPVEYFYEKSPDGEVSYQRMRIYFDAALSFRRELGELPDSPEQMLIEDSVLGYCSKSFTLLSDEPFPTSDFIGLADDISEIDAKKAVEDLARSVERFHNHATSTAYVCAAAIVTFQAMLGDEDDFAYALLPSGYTTSLAEICSFSRLSMKFREMHGIKSIDALFSDYQAGNKADIVTEYKQVESGKKSAACLSDDLLKHVSKKLNVPFCSLQNLRNKSVDIPKERTLGYKLRAVRTQAGLSLGRVCELMKERKNLDADWEMSHFRVKYIKEKKKRDKAEVFSILDEESEKELSRLSTAYRKKVFSRLAGYVLSKGELSNIELNKRIPSDETLKRLADLYEVSFDSLSELNTSVPIKDIEELAIDYPTLGIMLRKLVKNMRILGVTPEVFSDIIERGVDVYKAELKSAPPAPPAPPPAPAPPAPPAPSAPSA